MKKILLAIVAGTVLASVPLYLEAAQITPNPNPTGSTIDIINDPFAVNNANPYFNAGTINVDSSSTLTNNAHLLNNAFANLNNTGTLTNTGTVTNSGTLDNQLTTGMLINTGWLNNQTGATLMNSGTLHNQASATLTNSGLLYINGSSTLNNNGTLINATDGLLFNISNKVTNNGTLINAGRWDSASNGVMRNFGTLINAGFLQQRDGVTNHGVWTNYGKMDGSHWFVTNTGLMTNYGTMGECAVCTVVNSGTLNNNAGAINLSGASATLSNSGTLNNGTSATLTLQHSFESSTFPYNGTITNSGTLSNAGSIIASGQYLQTAGLTTNNGTLTAKSVDIQGGTLRGTGTINAPVTLSSGALLRPGDTATLGKLTINGNFQSSGNLVFHIGGLATGKFDLLAIHGMAFFDGGSVRFSFVDFKPMAGNSWDFLSANSITGWNTVSHSVSELGPGLTYSFSYANGIQTLKVFSVPEPSSLLLLLIGLGGIASWRKLKGTTW
jgi:hypothetical protein